MIAETPAKGPGTVLAKVWCWERIHRQTARQRHSGLSQKPGGLKDRVFCEVSRDMLPCLLVPAKNRQLQPSSPTQKWLRRTVVKESPPVVRTWAVHLGQERIGSLELHQSTDSC